MPLTTFLEVISDPARRGRMMGELESVDIDLSCRHGLDFDSSQILKSEAFPEVLEEITQIGSAIYATAITGQKMAGDIPLQNLYYHNQTELPISPATASKYVITAILGSFLSRPEAYRLVQVRSRSLYKEMLLSAVSSVIYNVESSDVDFSQTYLFFHCAVALQIIYSDVYWNDSRAVDVQQLEVARGFLFADAPVVEKLMDKALGTDFDGTEEYILSYLHRRINCSCMDHKVKWATGKKLLLEGGQVGTAEAAEELKHLRQSSKTALAAAVIGTVERSVRKRAGRTATKNVAL
eukprot:CAMPEP_0182499814 /NCGR_PEP_ID=MMETSP1321-20130603/7969_1 /TAXON_ID=91990 /ORGANISM="Bolidomonas sp., Strain RCC1657" /LENGTH=293 /DNA_ID=CAMNT_0024704063 /DNA_START=51 /DNA_END=936 /DNA_ORIENTATION=-